MTLPIQGISPLSTGTSLYFRLAICQFGLQAYCMGKGKECSIMQKHMEKPNTGPHLQVDFEKNVCWLVTSQKEASNEVFL